MWWPFLKKPAPPVSKKPNETRLTITLRDGTRVDNWWSNWDGRTPMFNGFLKWYFGRPESGVYVVRYDKGEISVLRSDIARYEIKNTVEAA